MSPEGKVIKDRSHVESRLGVTLGEAARSTSSPQQIIKQEAKTPSALANDTPPDEEREFPEVMVTHGSAHATLVPAFPAESTGDLRRQINLLDEEQAERLLELLGDDVVANDKGHYVVDLDVLAKPRLIALRDFVARQLSTSVAKKARIA